MSLVQKRLGNYRSIIEQDKKIINGDQITIENALNTEKKLIPLYKNINDKSTIVKIIYFDVICGKQTKFSASIGTHGEYSDIKFENENKEIEIDFTLDFFVTAIDNAQIMSEKTVCSRSTIIFDSTIILNKNEEIQLKYNFTNIEADKINDYSTSVIGWRMVSCPVIRFIICGAEDI